MNENIIRKLLSFIKDVSALKLFISIINIFFINQIKNKFKFFRMLDNYLIIKYFSNNYIISKKM